MHDQSGGKNKVLIIFALLAVLFIVGGIIAYYISGHMGIEERFSQATGIESDGQEHENLKQEDGGILGFNIEGSVMLYAIILAVLMAIIVAYYFLSQK